MPTPALPPSRIYQNPIVSGKEQPTPNSGMYWGYESMRLVDLGFTERLTRLAS
jgi:hypothetical protein